MDSVEEILLESGYRTTTPYTPYSI